MRVVLDTNVVMSALFFGGYPLKIVRSVFSKKVELVATQAVLSEYREVAERLHFQFPLINYRRPLAMLESKIIIVRGVKLQKPICHDPDDDVIISCAIGGKAKIICSGDNDLLSINGKHGLEILKPSVFCERMGL